MRSCSSDIQREREERGSGLAIAHREEHTPASWRGKEIKAQEPFTIDRTRIIAQEIVDDLEAACEQFRLIANDLGEAPENGSMSESFQGKV